MSTFDASPVPVNIKTSNESPRNMLDGRLPRDVTPFHYNLELRPDIYQPQPPFTFNGSVQVFFTCLQAVDYLVLNSKDLEISGLAIGVDPNTPVPAPPPVFFQATLNPSAQFLNVQLESTLVVGAQYYLSMNFQGVMGSSGNGLYYDSYVDTDGTTKYMAATQMESIEARGAFPCFDEPDLKASFNITVVSKLPHVVLSNMNLLRTENRADGWVANVFAKSPIMSTYQVCTCVGDFVRVEAEWQGVTSYPVGIYARPQMVSKLGFAAKVAPKLQAWLEQETNITYSLPKMDHVALPSKSGAMENWGVITYGEDYLGVDPETSAARGKLTAANIIAHELAHSWFGNLVTAKWWDDIWLNEGFATYYNYYPLSSIGWPTSQIQQGDSRRGTQQFLDIDQRNTSDPIRKVIDTVFKAEDSFDGSTYPKGGAMLRMMRSTLTQPTFNKALTKYLNKYSYSSATTDQLWAELTAQAAADGILNPDGSALDMKAHMDAWLNQMGYPLLTVTRVGDGTATVQSQRFFSPRGQIAGIPSNYSYSWSIPITVATATTNDWSMRPSHYIRLGETSTTITGVPTSNGAWFVINARQTGFYRVDYDVGLRADIVRQLRLDRTRIHEESRSQLVDDSFALARTLIINETLAMDTTLYLSSEVTPNPWLSALKHIGYADPILRHYALYPSYSAYVVQQLVPVYDLIGWQVIDMESALYQELRSSIVRSTCLYGHAACLDAARQLFVTYSANPDVNSVAADYLPTVLCVGVSEGSRPEWNMVNGQYQNRRTSQMRDERYAYLYGLACSKDLPTLDGFLNDIIGGVQIAVRDQNQALTYLIQNNLGRSLVWTYLDGNWNTVPSTISKLTALRSVISTFYDAAGLASFDAFVAKYPASTQSTQEQYFQMRLIIQQNIDWITANEQSLATWLGQQVLRSTVKLSAAFAMSPVDRSFGDSYHE
jgi:aminopeptidase N